jgi:hypothetical protein
MHILTLITIYRASPLTHHHLYQCPSAVPSHSGLSGISGCADAIVISRAGSVAPRPLVCESLLHVRCVTGCGCSSHKFIKLPRARPAYNYMGFESHDCGRCPFVDEAPSFLCPSWGVPHIWPTIAKGTRISHLRMVPRSPQVPLAVDSFDPPPSPHFYLENAASSLAAKPLVCRSLPAPMFHPSQTET